MNLFPEVMAFLILPGTIFGISLLFNVSLVAGSWIALRDTSCQNEPINGVRFVTSAFACHEASLLHWWLWRLQLPLWYGGTVVDATRRCAMSTAIVFTWLIIPELSTQWPANGCDLPMHRCR